MAYWHHHHYADRMGDPCEYRMYNESDGTLKECGRSWDSVLHPPDQYRHWCGILDAGGDCDHEDGDW